MSCLGFVQRVCNFFDLVKPLVYTRQGVDCCNNCMWEAACSGEEVRPWALMYSSQAKNQMFEGRDLHIQHTWNLQDVELDDNESAHDEHHRFMNYIRTALHTAGFSDEHFTLPDGDDKTIVIHQGVTRISRMAEQTIEVSRVIQLALQTRFARDPTNRRQLTDQMNQRYRTLSLANRRLSRHAARLIIAAYTEAASRAARREEPVSQCLEDDNVAPHTEHAAH